MCNYDSCSRSRYAKGLCEAHYAQLGRGSELKPINPNRGRQDRVDRSARSCAFDGCSRPMGSYKELCPGHRHQAYRGEELRTLRRSTKLSSVADIEAQCEKVSGCWKYPGPYRHGYARAQVGGKTQLVHRLSYMWSSGDTLTSREHVHHKCANTWCVNPEHLEPATAAENNLEMLARKSYVARIETLEARVLELEAELAEARLVRA